MQNINNAISTYRTKAREDYAAFNHEKYKHKDDYQEYMSYAMRQFDRRWEEYTANVTYESYYMTTNTIPSLNTSKIQFIGRTSGSLNFGFNDEWRNFAKSNWCDIGISMAGTCEYSGKKSHGPTTFNIYYTYQGEKKLALSLYIEGYFDDDNFYGWEHAYEYAVEGNDGDDRDDHVEDNDDSDYYSDDLKGADEFADSEEEEDIDNLRDEI